MEPISSHRTALAPRELAAIDQADAALNRAAHDPAGVWPAIWALIEHLAEGTASAAFAAEVASCIECLLAYTVGGGA